MKTHTDKSQENKSQSVANTVSQKKSGVESTFQFVDNRPEAIAQRKLQMMANSNFQGKQITQMQSMPHINNDRVGVVQRVTTLNITNTTNNYDSGWMDAETQSTGVDSGPRAEAQAVANIAGGTWVGGHMVNDRLGGHGGFGNIVPITATMNNQHHTIENAAQNIVGNGGTAYEVRYYMDILHRDDYTFTPSGDKVNNLADRFQQSYQWRRKEVQAGGTTSRPIAYQAPGAITTVNGQVLDMA